MQRADAAACDLTYSQSGAGAPAAVTGWEAPCAATTLTIPATFNGGAVTSIANNAFEGRSPGLTTVTIPNSVTAIGESAFKDITSLTSLTLGTIRGPRFL